VGNITIINQLERTKEHRMEFREERRDTVWVKAPTVARITGRTSAKIAATGASIVWKAAVSV